MHDQPAQSPRDAEISVQTCNAMLAVGLDRPASLNALTVDMRRKLAEAFPRAARDPNIYCVVMRSLVDKAFCVGGDVREMVMLAGQGREPIRQALADEYALNWLLECFSKPTVSLINGPVMGSGVGITAYGTHRVAGERYRWAMPEAGIGFFVDVGVANVLARLPGEIGTYLALTGRAVGRADAYALGLVTHCIDSGQFGLIAERLADADPVDPLLDERHVEPGPGDLVTRREVIERCFSGASVGEIAGRLAVAGDRGDAWARGVLDELSKKSPLALAVCLRHVRQAAKFDLRETLGVDYRLACRMVAHGDFNEGVRAMLVDKDGTPRWAHGGFDAVGAGEVDAFFAPLTGTGLEGELQLPTRADMQAARV